MSRSLRERITEMPWMIRVAHNFPHRIGARRSSIKNRWRRVRFSDDLKQPREWLVRLPFECKGTRVLDIAISCKTAPQSGEHTEQSY